MTRDEFIEAFRHEFCGMIADAVSTQRQGSELGARLRMWFQRVDQLLAKAYADAQPAKSHPKLPENQQSPHPPKRTT